MSDWYDVQIQWRKAEEGGRRRPPNGPVYTTVSRFPTTVPLQEWSVVLQFTQSNGEPAGVEGRVKFLTDEAPAELLMPGAEFVLIEGPKIVANVQVLADSEREHALATQAHCQHLANPA